MSDYTPPLQDVQFVLNELEGLQDIAALPGYGEAAVEALLKSWVGGPKPALAADRLLRSEPDSEFLTHKILLRRFYADHVLSRSVGLRHAVVAGAGAALAYAETAF